MAKREESTSLPADGRTEAGRTALAGATLLGIITVITLSGALSKEYLFPVVGPEGVAALRVAYSFLILSCLFRPWRARPGARVGRNLIFYGCAMGLMNLFIFCAIERIPLGIAMAIEVTGPMMLALASSRRLTHFMWIGLAIAGLALLLPVHQAAGDLDPVGILFAFGAAAAWAGYIIFGKKVSALDGRHAVALGALVAGLFVLPVGIWQAGPALFTPEVLLIGLGIALMSSAIPYTVEIAVMRHLPHRLLGTLNSTAPAIGALIGGIVLGEILSPVQWLAIFLIMLAAIGTTLMASRH